MRWLSVGLYVCRCRGAETNCAASDGEDFQPHRCTLARDPGPSGRAGLGGRFRSAAGQTGHARVNVAVAGSVVVLVNVAGGC